MSRTRSRVKHKLEKFMLSVDHIIANFVDRHSSVSMDKLKSIEDELLKETDLQAFSGVE